MRVSHLSAWLVIGVSVVAGGCANPQGKTPQAKRDFTLKTRDDALASLYRKVPAAQEDIEQGPGYAVLNNIGFGFGFFGGGNGYGVVVDNETKQPTYMRMFQLVPGFGVAGEGYQTVLVFKDHETLNAFRTGQWSPGGMAQATFKFGSTGGSLGGQGPFNGRIKAYNLTDSGIVLRAGIPIWKYSQDAALNKDAMEQSAGPVAASSLE
jgi:hypothetical protein